MRNRIPLGCVFVMRYLQAFRFGYAPFRFTHFAKPSLHPAYAHQIPMGFFQSLLNYHRDNLYIISFFYGCGAVFFLIGFAKI